MRLALWIENNSRLALGLLAALALAIVIPVWLSAHRVAPSVEAISKKGELVVLTLRGPTTYEREAGEPSGYEVDLAAAFAASLGAEPRFVVADDIDTLLTKLEAGQGHIAAANLTVTESREQQIRFGPAYKSVKEQLVCHRGGVMPRKMEELAYTDLLLVRGSSYEETARNLAETQEGLSWQSKDIGSAMPLLVRIAETERGCTVADSHLVSYARRLYPELAVPMDLTEERPLAWAVNENTTGLAAALDAWFESAHDTGLLRQLDERWFGHLDDFDYVDVARFRRRVESRLPDYRALFEAAALETPFEWRLLAAQAYQESHWDPGARSPTGVRGLMMLTLPTAGELGVSDRLDPAQSIDGGARYLTNLYNRLPEEITGEDRVWFALGAYNVGYNHIRSARTLAERDDLNPNLWSDVALMLPRLSKPEYYRTLRTGYARGWEPVRYVQKVREYDTILASLLEAQPEPELAPVAEELEGEGEEPPGNTTDTP